MKQLKERLPHGMDVVIGDDKSVFINDSIDEVYQSIIEAILLVVLIIFIFLH